MQIALLPLWPGFILVGFFFGYAPMLALWVAATFVAVLHHKELRMAIAVPVLVVVGLAVAMLAMIFS